MPSGTTQLQSSTDMLFATTTSSVSFALPQQQNQMLQLQQLEQSDLSEEEVIMRGRIRPKTAATLAGTYTSKSQYSRLEKAMRGGSPDPLTHRDTSSKRPKSASAFARGKSKAARVERALIKLRRFVGVTSVGQWSEEKARTIAFSKTPF